MHGIEYGSVFAFTLYEPFPNSPNDPPQEYDGYMFISEDLPMNGERKEFYIRIDPKWIDAVWGAEQESEKEPKMVQFRLEGMNWWANIQWSDEHKGLVGRVPALYRCAVVGETFEDDKAKIQKAAEEWQEPDWSKIERSPARPILAESDPLPS